MERYKARNGSGNKYVLWLHFITGTMIFYFIVHPLTMVIYWFEISGTKFTLVQLLKVAPERILDSFSFTMKGMSITFIILGGLIGLGSGLYYRNILRKKTILQTQDKLLKRNILSIIQDGESDKVEFKSSLRYDYNRNTTNKNLEEVILKTISGYLNTNGGELLIGLDDSGNILGLEKDYISFKKKDRDGFELKIYQLITDYIGIEFCSLVHLSFYNIDDKDLCALTIESTDSPAYVHINNKTSFYIRTGNSTKPLTIKEAVKYISDRRNKSE